MVVAAIWFGCNNAARDIVGEWTIYKRERMVTLKLIPYVFSKLAVLFALCVFQCGSMLGIVYYVCGLHSNFLYQFASLLIASLIGAGLGLCISAISRTNESAIALLPVVLLPVIALGGGMRPIYQLPVAGRIVSTVIPSRWAFEANLLQEAKAEDWKPERPAPLPAPPPVPQKSGAGQPQPPACIPSAPLPQMPSDIAEHSLPGYVIAVNDSKGNRLRPALESEYPDKNSMSKAEKFRHRYIHSVSVLGGMFVLLVTAVIVILRKRDSDMQ